MYLHMDLSESSVEADYWKEKLKEKSEWRDEFFEQFKELLPPSKIRELNKKPKPPQEVAKEQNINALEGH